MTKHKPAPSVQPRYGVALAALAPGAVVQWNWAGGVPARVLAVGRERAVIRWQSRDGRYHGDATVYPSSLLLVQPAPSPTPTAEEATRAVRALAAEMVAPEVGTAESEASA